MISEPSAFDCTLTQNLLYVPQLCRPPHIKKQTKNPKKTLQSVYKHKKNSLSSSPPTLKQYACLPKVWWWLIQTWSRRPTLKLVLTVTTKPTQEQRRFRGASSYYLTCSDSWNLQLQKMRSFCVFEVKKHGNIPSYILSNSVDDESNVKTESLFSKIVSVTCLGVLESMKCIFIPRMPKFIECRFASTLLRGRWGW